MSKIDDLKQSPKNNHEDGNTQRVNITAGSQFKRPFGDSSDKSTSDRIEFDLSQMPKPKDEYQEKNLRKSIADDVLNGPDSPFEQYKKAKMEEVQQRIAEQEDEERLKSDEAELKAEDDGEIGNDSLYNDENSDDNDKEMIDISQDMSYQLEEENIYPEGEDTEDDNEHDRKEELDENKSDEEKVEVKYIPEKDKKEEYKVENPDIDIETESTNTTFEFEAEDESNNQEEDTNEVLKKLQKLATERLKPVSQKLDISSFTVLKKASNNTKLLEEKQIRVAKWVLPNQDSVVLMKEYLGSELEALREFSEDNTSMTQLSRKYHSIYDHIVSPKPATYEMWAKTTPFSDIDHYFFAVYIASFKGANFLPMDCENKKCGETFLTDDVSIMDMVKFENKKAREKFVELYNGEARYNGKGIYCTEIVPLSNKIAVGFKDPSVFNLLEISSLDQRFRDRYSSIIDYIPYIDSLYIIDAANSQLIPVGYKTYSDNIIKTTRSKIQKYDSVLKTLTVDEFGPIKAYLRAISENREENRITYKYPAVTCPKCGQEITEKPGTAEELVFTRYQLGALVNTSLD